MRTAVSTGTKVEFDAVQQFVIDNGGRWQTSKNRMIERDEGTGGIRLDKLHAMTKQSLGFYERGDYKILPFEPQLDWKNVVLKALDKEPIEEEEEAMETEDRLEDFKNGIVSELMAILAEKKRNTARNKEITSDAKRLKAAIAAIGEDV